MALESCPREDLGRHYSQVCILLLLKTTPLPKSSGSFELRFCLTIASLEVIQRGPLKLHYRPLLCNHRRNILQGTQTCLYVFVGKALDGFEVIPCRDSASSTVPL